MDTPRETRAGYEALKDEFSLAVLLVRARGRAKLTQTELAERLGTSRATIVGLESGASEPTLSMLRGLAAAGRQPR